MLPQYFRGKKKNKNRAVLNVKGWNCCLNWAKTSFDDILPNIIVRPTIRYYHWGKYCPSCRSFQKHVEMYRSCLLPWPGKKHMLYFVNFPVIIKLPPSLRGRAEAVDIEEAKLLSHFQKCVSYDVAVTCPGCNPTSRPVGTGIGSPLWPWFRSEWAGVGGRMFLQQSSIHGNWCIQADVT